MGYSKISREIEQQHQEHTVTNAQSSDIRMCFWLGFILSLFGVLIAAVIAKGQGVRAALRGVLWGIVVVIGIAFIVVTLPHAIEFVISLGD